MGFKASSTAYGACEFKDETELKITRISQAVKNENRVNVFVNNKYAFSLDIFQLTDYKIKIGQVISTNELEEFKKASEFGKLYQRTLNWLLSRPHSQKEVRDYLFRKVYEKELDKEFIDKIIERLKDKKYIDDRAFAGWYAENRFLKKGISSKRLKMELTKKGVDKGIIESVMVESGRDDENEILKMIAKKRAKYDDERLIQYLCRQGFSYEMVRNLVQSYETD